MMWPEEEQKLRDENEWLRERVAYLEAALEQKHERHRAIDGGTRHRVWARDKGTCQYCGKQGPYEEVPESGRLPRYVKGVNMREAGFGLDHVIPLSRGGTSDEANLVVACRECNSSKHDLTLAEWGRETYREFTREQMGYDAHEAGLYSLESLKLHEFKRKGYPFPTRSGTSSSNRSTMKDAI